MIHFSFSWMEMYSVFLLLDGPSPVTNLLKYWNERYKSGMSAACCRISPKWLPKSLQSCKHRPAKRCGPNFLVSIWFVLPFLSNSLDWVDWVVWCSLWHPDCPASTEHWAKAASSPAPSEASSQDKSVHCLTRTWELSTCVSWKHVALS